MSRRDVLKDKRAAILQIAERYEAIVERIENCGVRNEVKLRAVFSERMRRSTI